MSKERETKIAKKQPAIRSQHRGKTAEEIVLADLTKRGHIVRLVRQKTRRTKAKTVYVERQGCDISGSTPSGQAIFVEVKAYQGRIPICERCGLTFYQLTYMFERHKCNAIALVAIVSPANDIFYVPVEVIINRLKEQHIKSYSLKFAVLDCITFTDRRTRGCF